MKTVFHTGMSKAGSTALQESLFLSRHRLLNYGILYPDNPGGINFNNHRILTQPLSAFEKTTRDLRRSFESESDLRASFQAFQDHLRHQIAEANPKSLILSCEHVWRTFSLDRVKKAREDWGPLIIDQITAVVYIRRPSSRYLSGLQQSLKHGVFLHPTPPSYQPNLAGFQALFGQDNLHLVLFDRSNLKGTSIISDFVERFLAEYGVEMEIMAKPRRVNTSVSAPALKLLEAFAKLKRQDKVGALDVALLRRDINRAENALKLSRPKIKTEAADRIDYANTQPLWLRDTYGLEFPDFDYARLEKAETLTPSSFETVEHLIDVDPDEFQTLVKYLASKAREPTVRTFTQQFCNTQNQLTRWVQSLFR